MKISAEIAEYELPGDFLQIVDAPAIVGKWGGFRFMVQQIHPEDATAIRAQEKRRAEEDGRSPVTGIPYYISVFDRKTLWLYPAPDRDYELELHYLRYEEVVL